MSGTSADWNLAKQDAALLEGLFGPAGGGGPRSSWQLARKSRYLLVLAREQPGGLAAALRWYRALRPAGRAYRALLTMVSRSPAWRFLPSVDLVAGEGGFVSRFEAETGRRVTAMLFGNPVQRHRRVVLRAVKDGEAAWVVKVGFSLEAIEAIEREREILLEVGRRIPGMYGIVDVRSNGRFSSIATRELAGDPLWDPVASTGEAVALLRGWTRFEERRELSSFKSWQRIVGGWAGSSQGLRERVGSVSLATAFSHGDFAAWNLLIDPSCGVLSAVDWEWADPEGVPGWDIVHFFCQDQAMVHRLGGARLVAATLEALHREPVRAFLRDCGWPTPELAFATYASALNPIFSGPKGESLEALCSAVWG
jgi:hypothetical protein